MQRYCKVFDSCASVVCSSVLICKRKTNSTYAKLIEFVQTKRENNVKPLAYKGRFIYIGLSNQKTVSSGKTVEAIKNQKKIALT